MRRLYEWKDTKGNTVSHNTSSGSVSNTVSTTSGFKERFKKLIRYYKAHKLSDKVEVKKLTEDSLEFTDCYDGHTVDYKIYIGSATEAWHLEVFTTLVNAKSGSKSDDLVGEGWTKLLTALRLYITIPVTGTPEYKSLLTESASSIADDFRLYENLWN